MKRLKRLAAILPKSAKLNSKHISKIKGGAGGDDCDHDKRTESTSSSGG